MKIEHWLITAEQKLKALTMGTIYHDDETVNITSLRDALEYFPDDAWYYKMAGSWQRIANEGHLMGRAGYMGDELGSGLIANRLVKDIMHLCFLIERVYAPYPKWFGTAFKQLKCADELYPILQEVQFSRTWKERETCLSLAYSILAKMHNGLHLTEPVEEEPSYFFGRPFLVIWGGKFSDALYGLIDLSIRDDLPYPPIGGVDQWSDNTVVLENHYRQTWVDQFKEMYRIKTTD
eukprot:TRINITY_DN1272_c0_g1_i2.p1 TRINITY_DN1272_c0_g1~~TRINITY_DN1272_c0_g1_i2.p1  ORF type:complete len:235 (+),score=39.60 TRINITY_DN1272_c0_g1_i2:766-1470(+)